MDKIPFSAYDIFGCVIPGFVLLVAFDYSLGTNVLLSGAGGIWLGVFVAVLAYVCGHLIAALSGYVFESLLVQHVLGAPERQLFSSPGSQRWSRYAPIARPVLPKRVQELVRARVVEQVGEDLDDRSRFLYCLTMVKHHALGSTKLDTFLYLYGFCRNLALSCVLAAGALTIDVVFGPQLGVTIHPQAVWWAGASLIAALVLFFRYVKFLDRYTAEVFLSFAIATTASTAEAQPSGHTSNPQPTDSSTCDNVSG